MDKSTAIDKVRAIKWEDDHLLLLDQRLLPSEFRYLHLHTVEEVADAIANMVVRGAPAIGIAAAYGFVMACRDARKENAEAWREVLVEKNRRLLGSRPTAINLAWAVKRMQERLVQEPDISIDALLGEASAIHQEDIAANLEMGRLGAKAIGKCQGILTHCNTGSLATGGVGTALGIIRTAWANGQIGQVYISETRPWLQGSRLTAWELSQDGIPATLIADSAAAGLMRSGKINWVITGADRVALNGDVANKIGTYSHAVNAKYHGIGFMVAAPVSTIDPATSSGTEIEIEERDPEELKRFGGKLQAPESVLAYNPVFDITPAGLVSSLVTESGIIQAPNEAKIRQFLGC